MGVGERTDLIKDHGAERCESLMTCPEAEPSGPLRGWRIVQRGVHGREGAR